jgi:hypothetical protein
MNRVISLAGCVVGVLLLAGCPGPKGPTLHPVEGTVLVGGQPMDRILIEFYPEGEGPTSTAVTDAQGHFVLKTLEQKPQTGAVEGMHRLAARDLSTQKEVETGRAASEEDTWTGKPPRISIKYGNMMVSGLQQSVSGPQTDLKIELAPYSEEEAAEAAKAGQAAATGKGGGGGGGTSTSRRRDE